MFIVCCIMKGQRLNPATFRLPNLTCVRYATTTKVPAVICMNSRGIQVNHSQRGEPLGAVRNINLSNCEEGKSVTALKNCHSQGGLQEKGHL